jgi:hypothetical protein
VQVRKIASSYIYDGKYSKTKLKRKSNHRHDPPKNRRVSLMPVEQKEKDSLFLFDGMPRSRK